MGIDFRGNLPSLLGQCLNYGHSLASCWHLMSILVYSREAKHLKLYMRLLSKPMIVAELTSKQLLTWFVPPTQGRIHVREIQAVIKHMNSLFFWFGGIMGSASGAEFPVSSLNNHVGFTPRLLYSGTHHSPESFTHLKTGWAQDAWLQWLYENWYFHLDISRWLYE